LLSDDFAALASGFERFAFADIGDFLSFELFRVVGVVETIRVFGETIIQSFVLRVWDVKLLSIRFSAIHPNVNVHNFCIPVCGENSFSFGKFLFQEILCGFKRPIRIQFFWKGKDHSLVISPFRCAVERPHFFFPNAAIRVG
jgi:hypothetical protein